MKFQVNDRNGYTLAEGRLHKNRVQAMATVARIEQRLEVERLVRASSLRRPMARPTQPAEFLHARTHDLYAPMATRRPAPSLTIAAIWIAAAAAGLLLAGGVL
jgi:hypothetical protein